MKKIISILVTAIMMCMISITAFATDNDDIEYQHYLGVIRDADGNVVELVPMPYIYPYVDSVYTLPAGGTFTTYQYVPRTAFQLMFGFNDEDGNLVTTRDAKIKMAIYNSASVGGTRYLVKSKTFSTNKEDYGKYDEFAEISTSNISEARPYYNGVFTNVSNKEVTARLVVLSYDEWTDS